MAEFSERFFRSGTLRIHVRDWGKPTAPPLVIVHGLRDHSHSFDDLARGLADRFHVLALDLRGHGDSETTPYYSFGHFSLDLHNCIRAFRLEQPVLVGHSMGGEIVSTYAGSFPDVPDRIVVIEGLGPPPIDPGRELQWTVAGYAAIDKAMAFQHGLADLEAAYRRLRERNPRLTETQARELALLGTRAREDGTLEWKFDPMLATLSVGSWFNLEFAMAFWRRVTVPTLLIHGAESGEFWRAGPGGTLPRGAKGTAPYLEPDDLARRVACFRDVRVVDVAGAGHMVHFDRPAELLAEVRVFLGAS
jgi:pimeloyl-ACP methyl ester carboxylesterase